ncbi:MAG: hypothetical protein D6722_14255 [Bacteroidetes bacterium]|nr:MAG: hypothetical protein D6722_14255 [Bacteroidota bacterium]
MAPGQRDLHGPGRRATARQLQPGARLRRLQIRDRYGRLYHEQTAPQAFWDGSRDGTAARSGIYYYSLEYECWEDNRWQIRHRRGALSLLR